ncbi:peptide synthetase [Microbacterium sp. cx-59]|uniref:peptide synthetase n=1 Tax=Microbacterium sp. cx-59 TaxID=2891207 RepID=UPI001E2E4390|nr:peptide synthetase [Microbacterium sp. cx-59]MCC4909381.1 peptide synthetase [Microbacterium sp. cx-59]
MRLTNVAQLSLPPGRLHSYVVPVRRTDRRLPVSFDQERHVGQGDRPGSWMAISFRMPRATRDELGAAWDAVVARHATLRTVFADEGGVRLYEGEAEAGSWRPHPVSGTTAAAVREIFDAECRPYAPGSYRLCVVEPDGEAPVVVIGADHSHVDMWSLVVLGRDLGLAVDSVRTGAPIPLEPVDGFAAHTAALERMPPAPAEVSERWEHLLAAEGEAMPRFPLPLGDLSVPHPEVVEVHDVLDADGVVRLTRAADLLRVRVTALALGVLTEVSLRLAGTPLRAVFPVHSRNDPRWLHAVGWFITNAVIECTDPDPRACAADVKHALQLGSFPLAPIFGPRGGMPATPGMFAISWLDTRRLPVSVPADADAHWVSAVIRTDGVMIWFVVNDTGLHLRCRYPDTPQARDSVGRWLEAVEEGVRKAADDPVVSAPPLA